VLKVSLIVLRFVHCNNKRKTRMKKQGWYIDESGTICTTSKKIKGCHFVFINDENYDSVQIVISSTGEVHEEYQLWGTLEVLQESIK